jgi:hypothetical protein
LSAPLRRRRSKGEGWGRLEAAARVPPIIARGGRRGGRVPVSILNQDEIFLRIRDLNVATKGLKQEIIKQEDGSKLNKFCFFVFLAKQSDAFRAGPEI